MLNLRPSGIFSIPYMIEYFNNLKKLVLNSVINLS